MYLFYDLFLIILFFLDLVTLPLDPLFVSEFSHFELWAHLQQGLTVEVFAAFEEALDSFWPNTAGSF